MVKEDQITDRRMSVSVRASMKPMGMVHSELLALAKKKRTRLARRQVASV